jgi:hypothetical protein
MDNVTLIRVVAGILAVVVLITLLFRMKKKSSSVTQSRSGGVLFGCPSSSESKIEEFHAKRRHKESPRRTRIGVSRCCPARFGKGLTNIDHAPLDCGIDADICKIHPVCRNPVLVKHQTLSAYSRCERYTRFFICDAKVRAGTC